MVCNGDLVFIKDDKIESVRAILKLKIVKKFNNNSIMQRHIIYFKTSYFKGKIENCYEHWLVVTNTANDHTNINDRLLEQAIEVENAHINMKQTLVHTHKIRTFSGVFVGKGA